MTIRAKLDLSLCHLKGPANEQYKKGDGAEQVHIFSRLARNAPLP
jgi:hypothetical protein